MFVLYKDRTRDLLRNRFSDLNIFIWLKTGTFNSLLQLRWFWLNYIWPHLNYVLINDVCVYRPGVTFDVLPIVHLISLRNVIKLCEFFISINLSCPSEVMAIHQCPGKGGKLTPYCLESGFEHMRFSGIYLIASPIWGRTNVWWPIPVVGTIISAERHPLLEIGLVDNAACWRRQQVQSRTTTHWSVGCLPASMHSCANTLIVTNLWTYINPIQVFVLLWKWMSVTIIFCLWYF
jgi:hypothetical protein